MLKSKSIIIKFQTYCWVFGLIAYLIACQSSSNNIQSEYTSESTENVYTDIGHQRILFLWRKMQFDSTLNDTVSSIELNSKYIKTMPDEVRAAVGFIATFIGNECTWDGKYSENRSNLKCRILTALNLGYQCSSKHLGFLRSKFAKDSAVLAQLNPGNCPTTPDGATIENTFDSITIIRYLDTIELQYAVSSVNLREGFYSNWTEQALFKYRSGSVFLISKLKSRLKQQLIKLEK